MSQSVVGGLQRRIAEVVARFEGRSAPRSADVRNGAVLPLLQAMGWDVFDTREVRPSVQVGPGSVDFALGASGGPARVFIEIRGHRLDPARLSDALRRARRAEVGLVVLTNGLIWRLSQTETDGEADGPVFELDLGDPDTATSATTLRLYLERQAVLSGEALRRAIGAGALVRAWRALVDRGDDLLVELLADEVRDRVGVRPDDGAIEAFLRELVVPSTNLPLPSAPPAHLPKGPGKPAAESPPRRRRSRVTVTLHGQSEEFGTFKDALVFLLAQLDARAEGFLESCSRDARFRTRTRCYLARSPEAIYPTNPDLAEHHVHLDDGWFLGTNSNNAQKMDQARAACEVAGLRFGTDVTVDLYSP